MENLYENYVSHFILILVFICMDLNLYGFEFVSYNIIC
jgi:hypothetical protein